MGVLLAGLPSHPLLSGHQQQVQVRLEHLRQRQRQLLARIVKFAGRKDAETKPNVI
jgi:hypothetical protein